MDHSTLYGQTAGSDPLETKVNIPLAVDLDGTLVMSDTLHEGLINAVKLHPLSVFALLSQLRRGKAAFKRHVAEDLPFDPAAMPYNTDLLRFLQNEKQTGRRIGLFTAADQSVADAVAAHLELFDVARGSDGVINLSGKAKASAIEAVFGPDFAYAGDGVVDVPIFERAKSVILVGPVARLKSHLGRDAVIEATFPLSRGVAAWMAALRLQHWAKNALVFAAAALAPPALPMLLQVVLLFVLMGTLASATYIVNDLLDLASDRRHPQKSRRPFASGAIPVRDGIVAACFMIPGSLIVSLVLPASCTLALIAYLVITLSYSFVLKRIAMVDVTVLAGLFTLRVLAGSLLLPTPISPWLLTFSMLFFFGLAVIKRYAELDRLAKTMIGDVRGARLYRRGLADPADSRLGVGVFGDCHLHGLLDQ